MNELTDKLTKLTKLKEAAYRTWSQPHVKPAQRCFVGWETNDEEKLTACLCLVSAAAYDKMNPADRRAFLNMESGYGELAKTVVQNEFDLTNGQISNLIVGFDTNWNDDACLGPSTAFAKEVADTLKKEGKL